MGASPRVVKSNEPSPKKRFGQHFLRDTGVVERIVRWIQPSPADLFLEIGAGTGLLSCRLAPKIGRLLAVEIDLDIIPELERALKPFPSAQIIQGDILQLDLEEIAATRSDPGQTLRIAGNLPYNVATAIIEKLLRRASLPIQDMFFMVQLEVAQRIAAPPGSRQYGLLSVVCQHYSEVRLGFKVSSACFVPRPQVSSAMISLRPKHEVNDASYEAGFELIAKAAFSYRRKTLANSMARNPALGSISLDLLSRADIDGSRRAEELSIEEYEHLARIYHGEFSSERA
jgi:16S rRNA (adenine1518-N6/adenine1519-N6)-dimethyltransferase